MKISFVFGTHEWNYLRHCLSLQSGWLNFRTFLVATILIISLRLGYASRLIIAPVVIKLVAVATILINKGRVPYQLVAVQSGKLEIVYCFPSK